MESQRANSLASFLHKRWEVLTTGGEEVHRGHRKQEEGPENRMGRESTEDTGSSSPSNALETIQHLLLAPTGTRNSLGALNTQIYMKAK